jgi:hypothetical protein
MAARDSVVDSDIVHRLVDVLYRLLLAVYPSSVNPEFRSLNAQQRALAAAFANTSAKTWGNVTLEAWSFRLHKVLQANSPSDLIDPRAAVYDMICEGSASKNITDDMLLLSNSVCMTQKCGITPRACLTSSARGNLEDMEMLIDKDKGDDKGRGFLRRTFTMVGHIRLSEFKRFP